MRLILFGLVALIASTAEAVASPACSGPWIPTYRSPPGCPLIVVERNPAATPPAVEVWRNGELVADATADIVTTQIYLDVDYYGLTCDGTSELAYVQSEPFVHHSIEVSNAQPGDEVVLDQGTVQIDAPGPCYVVSLPNVECYATQTADCTEPEGDDAKLEVGCSTSNGATGLPWLLSIGALLIRRRTQKRQGS
jgi:uncharacterized protein (TIGR03382 family)